MIDKLGSIGGTEQLRSSMAAKKVATTPVTGGDSFANAFKGALDKVNQSQQKATELGKQFQLGNPDVSLEETMIAGQTANLGFQSLVAVRNQMVKAYNEIMNMQV